MRLLKLIPILFLLVGCAGHAPVKDKQAEAILKRKTAPPPKEIGVLYKDTHERPCADVQADVLFMSDFGPNEASFIDHGARSVFRIGEHNERGVPHLGPLNVPMRRSVKQVKWYTLVEFMSYGKECTVIVREVNHHRDERLNGTRLIELLKELKGGDEE